MDRFSRLIGLAFVLVRMIPAGWAESTSLPGAGKLVELPPSASKTTEFTRESQHWSFKAPKRPAEPPVRNKSWVRNPIDAFILARLEKEGVAPSPEADRVALIRRLSLDLTGLPPAPAEVGAFLKDESHDAYERQVERLLGSRHFGEQWARHWLDLARYADTDGYEKDFYRPHAWRWRDWVIDSINRDQPYDEFTRDQIAGDLLPNATIQQRVATGFHRNTLLNREGGVDIEEDRVKNVVDRVSTLGAAWLGLTVGCAECHSHKYDPITQKEFYQLYAFFNGTEDRDIRAPRPEEMTSWFQKTSELDKAKQKYVATSDPEMEAWIAGIAALPDIWFIPNQEDYDLPTFGANNGANLYPQEDGSFLVTGMVENKTHYIMMLNTKLKGITGIRVEAMTDEMLPKLGPGWATNGNFVLTELSVESASLKDVNSLRTNPIESVTADFSQEGFPIAATIDGITTNGGWAVDLPHLPMHAVDRCAVFIAKEDIGYEGGMRLKVSLVQHQGNSHTLGRLRVSYTTAQRSLLAAQTTPQRIRDIAKVPEKQRTLDQKVALKRYFQATFRRQDAELAEYTKAMVEAPGVKGEVQAQTLAERRVPRTTHVHVRGNFLDRGAEVGPGTLAVLHPFKPRSLPPDSRRSPRAGGAVDTCGGGEAAANGANAVAGSSARSPRPDRIDLANWIVDPANPLTARVTVNQIWMHLFGEGVVSTVADFGAQGEKPSHPELLDWLATEFLKGKWSRKALIKLIVSSATYRQSSARRADLVEHDAKNRWLGRQNRFRLSAENARDQYLAASGLLDTSVGGQSVPASSVRRGLYVQFKRSFPEYMLTTFDAPSTTQTCPKRERSNTPLQALTLLNDKLFVQCAQALGRRIIQEKTGDVAGRVRDAFQLCLAREPTAEELNELLTLFNRVKQIYYGDLESALQVAERSALRDSPAPEAAAYAVVARTILNLDELITRE